MKYKDYSSESSRLKTFDLWPDNSPVPARLLAKAGFFCIDENTVVCFNCGGHFCDWKASDNPLVRHVNERKDCDFARNLQAGPSDVPNNDATQGQTPHPVTESTGQQTNSWLHSQNFNSDELYESYHMQCTSQCYKDLHTEVHRLHTFYDWPQHVPVTPPKLAKEGFFYLGIRDKVECAFCGGVLYQWEDGDDPTTEHRRQFPHCPFTRGLPTANVPLDDERHLPDNVRESVPSQRMFHPPSTGLAETEDELLGQPRNPELGTWTEHARFLQVAQGTQQHVCSPEKQLQQNGSSSQRNLEQQVNDAMDSTMVQNAVEMGFDPDDTRSVVYNQICVHGQSFTTICDLVQALLGTESDELIHVQDPCPTAGPRKKLLIQEPHRTGSRKTSVHALPVGTEWPKHPDFADEESRLSTFFRWPLYSPISPRRLARAGFLYTYIDDQVRCYWCDGGLKDWQQDSDPWEEHARWYGPGCGYVIMKKGMDYIREVRTREVRTLHPPAVQQPQYPWGIEASIIRIVLEMGFNKERIQAVVQNHWRQHNRPFTKATELLNALLPQDDVPPTPATPQMPTEEQPLDPETMERELRRLREERQCKVCLSADACMVFIPCRHLCCCEHCANMLRMRGRRCPLCRAPVLRVQCAFLA